jgi:tetratricopeptide (TPR) repeat protein
VRAGAPLLLGAALALGAGCPGAGPAKSAVPALSAASLPSEPDKLVQIADEQFDKGGVQNSVVALRHALEKAPDWAAGKDGYAAHWRIARAETELCDTDAANKTQHAAAGIAAGRKAIELEPERAEGHYYLAQSIGYSVQDQKGDSKELVAEIVRHAEKAGQIDEKFDHAGPIRFLGALYAKAPAPPLSIGDPEKAVKMLKRAVELDGAFPANHIYLADALVADERFPEADEVIKRARGMLADKAWDRYRTSWTGELGRVERKLRAKQG